MALVLSPSFCFLARRPIALQRPRATPRSTSSAARVRSSSSDGPPALRMDFPFLPPAHRSLMSDLLSSIDAHLPLLPASPPLLFQNSSAASKGSLLIVPGTPSSSVDFVLSSWIHCELPFGALDITTLSAFLRSTATDAPHLLLEFIQSGPKSMVVIMDLLPRKDLILHPDYLAHFYEETHLEEPRRRLAECPQVRPYLSSSLYVRSALSPTAVSVSVACEEEGELDAVVGSHVGEAAKGVVRVWLERCAGEGREVEQGEALRRRDELLKKKAIEVDLTANLPRLFGEDVARGVVEAIQKAFGV